jgi:predicted MFS family arabinose efflux permease
MVIPIGALYFGLQYVTAVEKAFVAALSVGVFYVIISREWDKRYDTRFWALISVFALIHVIALLFIRFSHYRGPALTIALPFMFIDGFAMWGILTWIDKRFPRKRKAAQ